MMVACIRRGEKSSRYFKTDKSFSVPNECNRLTNYMFIGDKIHKFPVSEF